MSKPSDGITKWLTRLIGFLAVVTGLLPLLGWIGGGSFWLLDLCNHFQYQYAWFLLLCAILLLRLQSRRMAMVAALLSLIPLSRVVPGYLPAPAVAQGSTVVKIASFNVLASNQKHARTIAWVKETLPDAIFFTEVSEEWTEALKALEGVYPHFINDGPDMAFFSKFPISSFEMHRVSKIEFRLLEARLATPGGPLVFFAGHPLPPLTPDWAKALDDFMAAAEQEVSQEQGRVVLVGDFNATRWSAKTKDLYKLGLQDASKGKAPGPTWSRGNPVLGIPIDHILFRGEGMSCKSFLIGPDIGSDHRPVVAELSW
ncbi:endonuclease/exonuclease/phosphatase family protein [Haloferula sp. BvORR071]|uniref:endonuclease/exonuclease/phosphatase family protein n=1 Tax=Haloferula sp. BvORR071 TaxID=1396141 RepID=UPI00055021A9|nr:endonuclease/exonuclease/phosphatase family protein [Haloferula sp. BvORR071]